MAAYFHGNPPEISAGSDGGLQTLILMNPTTYVQYTQQDNDSNNNNSNNSNTNNNNSFVFLDSHAPQPNASQQFVGIPLSGHEAASITAADNISVLHGYPPRVQYSLYGSHQVDPTHQQAACETPRAQQGLSLTLSSQQQQQQQQHHQQHQPIHVGFGSGPGEDIRVGSGSTGSGVTNGIANLVSSKYLKAAQELLDEVVNADSDDMNAKSQLFSSKKGSSGNDKAVGESSAGAGGEGSGGGGEAAGKRTVELGTAERQEIQMKKAKLNNMLHEVTTIRIIYNKPTYTECSLNNIIHEVDLKVMSLRFSVIFTTIHFICPLNLKLYFFFCSSDFSKLTTYKIDEIFFFVPLLVKKTHHFY